MNISRPLAVIFGPPILIGTSYIYWSKRRCYQWRQELNDDDFALYPRITPDLNKYVRKPHDKNRGMLEMENSRENPGLVVREGFLTDEEIHVIKDVIRDLCDEFGSPIPPEGVEKMKRFLQQCDLPSEYLDKVRFVSDRFEGTEDPRAKWGCGDDLRLYKLPLALRALNHKLHSILPHLGELRHIYIERSPIVKEGQTNFFRPPRPQRAFDGHEYIIMPLFEDSISQTRDVDISKMKNQKEATKNPGGAVVSFSPTKRDLQTDARMALMEGFTTADLDVFVPTGACLQVRGNARFRWAWGIRPGEPYFGNPQNPLPLGPGYRSLLNKGTIANSHLLKSEALASASASASIPKSEEGGNSSFWSNLFSFSLPSFSNNSSSDAITSTLTKNEQRQLGVKTQDILVMCFEGPFSENRQRSKATMLEYDCYGELPKPEHFSWAPDTPPSAEDLRQEGLLWWMFKNYPKLFNPTP